MASQQDTSVNDTETEITIEQPTPTSPSEKEFPSEDATQAPTSDDKCDQKEESQAPAAEDSEKGATRILEVSRDEDGQVKVKDNQTDQSPKPGTIASLSKSFETPNEDDEKYRIPRIKRMPGRSNTAAANWVQTAKDTEDAHVPRRLAEQPQKRGKSAALLDKFSMFNQPSAAPLEFGVHVTTEKDLEELTKKAKSIWISQEEKNEMKKRQETQQIKERQQASS